MGCAPPLAPPSTLTAPVLQAQYLLADGDLRELGHLEKANPQHRSWPPMRMYLHSQVGQHARPTASACGAHGVRVVRERRLRILAAPCRRNGCLSRMPHAACRMLQVQEVAVQKHGSISNIEATKEQREERKVVQVCAPSLPSGLACTWQPDGGACMACSGMLRGLAEPPPHAMARPAGGGAAAARRVRRGSAGSGGCTGAHAASRPGPAPRGRRGHAASGHQPLLRPD